MQLFEIHRCSLGHSLICICTHRKISTRALLDCNLTWYWLVCYALTSNVMQLASLYLWCQMMINNIVLFSCHCDLIHNIVLYVFLCNTQPLTTLTPDHLPRGITLGSACCRSIGGVERGLSGTGPDMIFVKNVYTSRLWTNLSLPEKRNSSTYYIKTE